MASDAPTKTRIIRIVHRENVPWLEGVSCPQSEIVHLVSSIERLAELGLQVIFTDRHALVQNAAFFSRPDELSRLDWPLLRSRDFKRYF